MTEQEGGPLGEVDVQTTADEQSVHVKDPRSQKVAEETLAYQVLQNCRQALADVKIAYHMALAGAPLLAKGNESHPKQLAEEVTKRKRSLDAALGIVAEIESSEEGLAYPSGIEVPDLVLPDAK